MKLYTALACIGLALPAHAAADLAGESAYFSRGDWELACDNTRTCRAAGYQADGDEPAVSVLLVRKAGAGQPVTGQLRMGDGDQGAVAPKSTGPIVLRMAIDGAPQGTVTVERQSLVGALSRPQVDALVASLSRTSSIAFTTGGTTWRLSDAGASAVLLKMDDFQGRVGTAGALVRKGTRSEDGVKPARTARVVRAARVVDKALGATAMLAAGDLARLRAALSASGGEACAAPADDEPNPIEAARLDDHHLLVSMLCWEGAYNQGYGFWVVADKPPFRPELVTTDGTDYADGHIDASQKGRGLADCGSTDEWVWDGNRFVQTGSARWGLCRMIAAGGAWPLPTLVSDVR